MAALCMCVWEGCLSHGCNRIHWQEWVQIGKGSCIRRLQKQNLRQIRSTSLL